MGLAGEVARPPSDGAMRDGAPPTPTTHRRAVVLLVLIGIGLSLTTSIMGVLLEPIRVEFGLSDSSLGMLANLGFGAGVVVTSLPGGIAADHWNRRNILGLCLIFAGLVTALGGIGGVVAIIVMRVVSGGFHGPNSPAITSLFSDIFPPQRRASILGIYFGAQSIGTLLDFLVGGYVATAHGWRATLAVFGLVSVAIGVAVFFLLREPSRAAHRSGAADDPPPSTSATFAFLWSQRAAVYVLAFSVLAVTTLSSTLIWLVSFFVRIYHLQLSQGGGLVALAIASGAVGTLVGGTLTDRLARKDPRWSIGVSMVLMVLATAAVIGMAFAPSLRWAVALMMLWAIGIHAHLGPAWSILQNLVPARMRGRSGSVLSGLSTLVGFGLGPWLTGMLSQGLSHVFARETLRYAVACANLLNVFAIMFCVLAIRRLPACIERVRAMEPAT